MQDGRLLFSHLRSLSGVMPFCCGKRSAGICVVRGPEKLLKRIPANTSQFFRTCRLVSARTPFHRNEGLLGQLLDS
jgi:hypothetical protein